MFAPKNFLFAMEDCVVVAENMMLSADSRGISSCYIGAGWKAFADFYGQEEQVMDAKTCLQKLQYVGVLTFATVDGEGNPQVRNISAIHYELDGICFFTARGKDFCRELLAAG